MSDYEQTRVVLGISKYNKEEFTWAYKVDKMRRGCSILFT